MIVQKCWDFWRFGFWTKSLMRALCLHVFHAVVCGLRWGHTVNPPQGMFVFVSQGCQTPGVSPIWYKGKWAESCILGEMPNVVSMRRGISGGFQKHTSLGVSCVLGRRIRLNCYMKSMCINSYWCMRIFSLQNMYVSDLSCINIITHFLSISWITFCQNHLPVRLTFLNIGSRSNLFQRSQCGEWVGTPIENLLKCKF